MNTKHHVNDIGFDARQAGHEDIDQWRPSDIATGVLWIVIPYTTPELTQAALRHAACLQRSGCSCVSGRHPGRAISVPIGSASDR